MELLTHRKAWIEDLEKYPDNNRSFYELAGVHSSGEGVLHNMGVGVKT